MVMLPPCEAEAGDIELMLGELDELDTDMA